MALSRAHNYHIRGIIHYIYKYNVYHNKKEIKFISIIDPSLVNYKAKFSHCMELIGDAVNTDHIVILKKQFNKVELKKLALY